MPTHLAPEVDWVSPVNFPRLLDSDERAWRGITIGVFVGTLIWAMIIVAALAVVF